MNKQRFRIILISLLLLISIWLAWPKTPPSKSPDSAQNNESNHEGFGWHLLGFGKNEKNNRPINRTQSSTDSVIDRIDSLIAHQTLSDREVAEQLLKIAEDKSIPDEYREAALSHGVLLDLSVFAKMAADSNLPPSMAENLLQNIINENQNPALQIRAYQDLLNHSSPEIRDQAKEVLAFILEDDSRKADDNTLRQMADARLKQIEVEKTAQD